MVSSGRPMPQKQSVNTGLDDNMVLREAKALRMDKRRSRRETSAAAPFAVQSRYGQMGFDSNSLFLRQHEVHYMEAHFVME